jgi:nitrilase
MAALETLEHAPRAVSMILDPTGEVISDVLADHEGIVYAEIDVARTIEPKQFHDVVGYYNRFDIFRLEVDRTPRDPAAFLEQDVIGTLAEAPMPQATESASRANGGNRATD